MHPMFKLLAENQRKGEFRAEAQNDTATIYVYDMIVDSDDEAEFWGGVSPQAFVKTLNAINAPTIHLRINSPGGSVFAARAMEQALREHPSNIIAHIDGYAASAASFLAMGADEIEIAAGAFFMIHKAWTVAWGNADDLVNTAGVLEKIDGSLVKTYADRTKQSVEDITQWMADETWLDAEQSVQLGFADRIAEGKKVKASWDMSAYAKAPPAPVNNEFEADRDELKRAALLKMIPA